MWKKRFLGVIGAALMMSSAAVADTTIVNGMFSSGLDGWTPEGQVYEAGEKAWFDDEEGGSLGRLSQVFTISNDTEFLSFDFVFVSNESPEGPEASESGVPSDFPDAFAAYLLDPVSGDALAGNPGRDDFYYCDSDGQEITIASVSGGTVKLDVSGLRGQEALLRFELLGMDGDVETLVSLDNVMEIPEVSVVPVPGAALLGIIGVGIMGLYRRVR